MIVYGLEHQSSPGGWFIMIVSVFLAPLLPMVLSAVASTLILSAALRFKYRNLATILLSVGAVLLVVGASFRMQNMNAEDFAAIGQAAAQQVNAVYPPAALLSGALNHGSILYFLYFVLLSLGSTGLFLLLMSLSFAKLNTALFSHHTREAYKMQRLGTASPLAPIYKKELRRLMSSSIYLLNTSVGEILLLVLSVLFLFTDQGQLQDLLGGYGIILEFSRSDPLCHLSLYDYELHNLCIYLSGGKGPLVPFYGPRGARYHLSGENRSESDTYAASSRDRRHPLCDTLPAGSPHRNFLFPDACCLRLLYRSPWSCPGSEVSPV